MNWIPFCEDSLSVEEVYLLSPSAHCSCIEREFVEVSSKALGTQSSANTVPLPCQDSLRRNPIMEMTLKKPQFSKQLIFVSGYLHRTGFL